jgi:hypothetical protein
LKVLLLFAQFNCIVGKTSNLTWLDAGWPAGQEVQKTQKNCTFCISVTHAALRGFVTFLDSALTPWGDSGRLLAAILNGKKILVHRRFAARNLTTKDI